MLGCVQQPGWRAAMYQWQLPPAAWSVSPLMCLLCLLAPAGSLLMAAGLCSATRWPAAAGSAYSAGRRLHQCLQLGACCCGLVPSGQGSTASCEAAGPQCSGPSTWSRRLLLAVTLRRPPASGAWRDVWVDPNAWLVGTQPVSHYLVKSAARRVLLLGLRARDSGLLLHGAWPSAEVVAGPGWLGWSCGSGAQMAGPVVAPVRPVARAC